MEGEEGEEERKADEGLDDEGINSDSVSAPVSFLCCAGVRWRGSVVFPPKVTSDSPPRVRSAKELRSGTTP